MFPTPSDTRPLDSDYDLEVFSGIVVDGQVWSETRVSGSGSSVSFNGYGAGSSHVTSVVTNMREFCVETESGVQEIFRFNADQVRVAHGQRVSLVRYKKKNKYIDMAIVNHSMKKTTILKSWVVEINSLYAFLTICGPFANLLFLLSLVWDAPKLPILLLGNIWYFMLPRLNQPLHASLYETITRLGGEAPEKWARKSDIALNYAKS